MVTARSRRGEAGRFTQRSVRFQHGSAAGSEPRQALRQRETPRGGASPFSQRSPCEDGRRDGCDKRGTHSEMWANCSPLPLGPPWRTEAWQPEAEARQWSDLWRSGSADAAHWSGPWCRSTDSSADAAPWRAGPAQWSGPWRWKEYLFYDWQGRAEREEAERRSESSPDWRGCETSGRVQQIDKNYWYGGPYMSPLGEGHVAQEPWRKSTPRWEDVSPLGEGHVAQEIWRSWTPRWDEEKVSDTRSSRRRQRHAQTTLQRHNTTHNDNTNQRTTTQRLNDNNTPTGWQEHRNAVQGTTGQRGGRWW
jgi:hypothetical protein